MPETREFVTDGGGAPAADELEQRLASIIAGVLDVERVGRQDSFFELGGASMEAIRVCARVERELGCVVEPVWLLENDELGAFIDKVRDANE